MQITLSVIFGGRDSEIVQPVTRELKRRLGMLKSTKYSKDLDEIRLRLGVSGNIDKFKEPNGASGFKIQKKARYASVELTVQQDIWKKGEKHVESMLRLYVEQALSEICKRCKKAGLDIQSEKLILDLQKVFS